MITKWRRGGLLLFFLFQFRTLCFYSEYCIYFGYFLRLEYYCGVLLAVLLYFKDFTLLLFRLDWYRRPSPIIDRELTLTSPSLLLIHLPCYRFLPVKLSQIVCQTSRLDTLEVLF